MIYTAEQYKKEFADEFVVAREDGNFDVGEPQRSGVYWFYTKPAEFCGKFGQFRQKIAKRRAYGDYKHEVIFSCFVDEDGVKYFTQPDDSGKLVPLDAYK